MKTIPSTTTTPDSSAIGPPGDHERHHVRPSGVDAARALLAYVAMCGLWIGAGLLVKGPLDSTVGALDRHLTGRLVAHRTPHLNSASHIGTLLAETGTKVAVTIALAVIAFAIWRRWSDVLLLCGTLALEAAVFLTVTLVVDRHRPAVVRLDSSPVGSSFPSGHTAAAAAYGAAAVVMWRHRHRRATAVVTALVVAVVLIVAWSRMYRGMHFFSDVVAGALLGTTAVLVTAWIVDRAERRAEGELA